MTASFVLLLMVRYYTSFHSCESRSLFSVFYKKFDSCVQHEVALSLADSSRKLLETVAAAINSERRSREMFIAFITENLLDRSLGVYHKEVKPAANCLLIQCVSKLLRVARERKISVTSAMLRLT